MRGLLVVLAGAAAACLWAPAAAETPSPYAAPLGPDLPGLGTLCEANMRPLGAAGASNALVSLSSWLADLQMAVESQNPASYEEGIQRLCGGFLRPDSVAHHAAMPAAGSDAAKSVGASLSTLQDACSKGDGLHYGAAFRMLCPRPAPLGPVMPEGCNALVADPRQAPPSSKTLRLHFFLSVLSELLDAQAGPDDDAWRRAMEALCAEDVGVSGTGFHSHAPRKDTPLFREVSSRVDAMEAACSEPGSAAASGYAAAFSFMCPAAPSANVVASGQQEAEAARNEFEAALRAFKAAAEAAVRLNHLAGAAVSSAQAAAAPGAAAPASVAALDEEARKLASALASWDEEDKGRAVPVSEACGHAAQL
ncbi:hypothetical protein FNF27_03633 [Cafeteria roenbergensis]|uniref:Uncharacterized protein n=2 Tax=Cafeteria roenbergensis TaxID=33653 RepID=A0A5A8D954_CAFRO|nr:hypothetical protein FNF29_05243 [Cafeteria roenbergensis]KAA0162053.1 hypothetical protein FNF31_03464 [Cafeteria roenbergensis]KAA0167636.1 hypothetical protein FNF28_02704 [Cafeteria roenbergensis]KAA0174918.1 hypothetical protein FNF27_03633 [Cafeteria roenbergensis]|eukprot:KAA0150440.1 hypothetical protein FNF29_05243 [Cafeteria roenbergensis]